jgi:PAT family beta-lactamase induction signal transducer AmpG
LKNNNTGHKLESEGLVRHVGWLAAFKVYRKPQVVAMLFLGFSAGLPFLLVFSTLTAWLTEAGVTRTTIGFFSWIGVTYSVKVFWAPVVDQFKLPILHSLLGQRRSWMLLAQIGIAIGLLLMSSTNPLTELQFLAFCGLLVAFSSATQDISVDAFRIEAAVEEYQAAMSATYVFGYRLALLVSGAGAFYIAEYSSWQWCYVVMAGLMLVGVVTVFLVREPERLRQSDDGGLEEKIEQLIDSGGQVHGIWSRFVGRFTSAVVGPFVDFFRRNGMYALLILVFISVYRISDITMGVMANPFYLDMGFSKLEIANISKIFGFFMLIAGSLLGGVLVAYLGCKRILVLGATLVASTNLLFAYMALTESNSLFLLSVVIGADNLSGGLASVAFIAYLSGLTSSAYTATQYALFSSLMTLPGKFIGGFSGWMVDSTGYVWFFVTASLMGIPAIILSLFLVFHDRKKNTLKAGEPN